MNDLHDNNTQINNSARMSEPVARHYHHSGGRYLKQPPSRKHGRRHRRRRLNPRFVILIAVLLVLLIGICLGVRYFTKSTIHGRWDLDGTTIYEFHKDGTGALVLMYSEYEFNYIIDGDEIIIDFKDEAALDAKYTFKVDKRILFLTGGPGDAKTDYVLYKVL